MKPVLLTIALAAFSLGLGDEPQKPASEAKPATAAPNVQSAYDFTVKDIDGKDMSLSKYRGQVSIVVNVASE